MIARTKVCWIFGVLGLTGSILLTAVPAQAQYGSGGSALYGNYNPFATGTIWPSPVSPQPRKEPKEFPGYFAAVRNNFTAFGTGAINSVHFLADVAYGTFQFNIYVTSFGNVVPPNPGSFTSPGVADYERRCYEGEKIQATLEAVGNGATLNAVPIVRGAVDDFNYNETNTAENVGGFFGSTLALGGVGAALRVSTFGARTGSTVRTSQSNVSIGEALKTFNEGASTKPTSMSPGASDAVACPETGPIPEPAWKSWLLRRETVIALYQARMNLRPGRFGEVPPELPKYLKKYVTSDYIDLALEADLAKLIKRYQQFNEGGRNPLLKEIEEVSPEEFDTADPEATNSGSTDSCGSEPGDSSTIGPN